MTVDYQAPEADAQFLLFDLFEVDQAWQNIPAFADFSRDLIEAVITEGAKVTSEVVAPTNQIGDEQGCQWQGGTQLPFYGVTRLPLRVRDVKTEETFVVSRINEDAILGMPDRKSVV